MRDVRTSHLWIAFLFTTALAAGARAQSAASEDGDPAHTRTTWAAPRAIDAGFDTRVPPRGCARFQTANQPPEGDFPQDLAFTPDGQAAVIVHTATDNITFFSLAT